MTQKEKLEAESERFPTLAETMGLTPPASRMPMSDAREFAYQLMSCPTEEEARKLMLAQRARAQAFWQVMETVQVRVRTDRIRPGVPPMNATGPLAVVACTVLEYCEAMDARLSDDF